jgi:hypothetical protein
VGRGRTHRRKNGDAWPATGHPLVRGCVPTGFVETSSRWAATEPRENQEVRPDMSPAVCSLLDTIEFTAIPDRSSAEKGCLKIGSRWVHLRM